MGVKLEKIVKPYYDALEEGKIMGRRCKKCGAVEFPPVLACNTCGSTDMEWIEMSGKAKVLTLISMATLNIKPNNEDLKPYCLGIIEMEEGSQFNGLIVGINKKKKKELEPKLPLPVHAKIIQRDGYKTIVFELDEAAKGEEK